jgi:type IV pilus assembly protein PilM
MDDNEQEKQKKLNDVVRSKIKGLGLDALFHQVDVTKKDERAPDSSVNGIPDENQSFPRLLSRPLLKQAAGCLSAASVVMQAMLLRKKNSAVIFDIGTSAIKIAVFSAAKNAVLLRNAFLITIPHLISASHEKQRAFVQESLRNALGALPREKPLISTILPRSAAIVKFLTLPTLHKEEIKKMLDFEAEQHLPFPPADVEMDYQILAKNPPGSDIILAAIKRADISKHLALFDTLGIHPDIVTISSLALYNAGRLHCPSHGVSAQVHIGATFTDINIIQDGVLRFSRSLHWGGKNLTLRLAADLHINFDNAEKIKKENGILLTKKSGHQTQLIISDNARAWAAELSTEIKRTIESFQLTIGASDPAQIRLSGGASRLINLNECLRETLRTKIIIEKPLPGYVASTAAEAYDKYFLEMHPLFGVNTGNGLELNLLPQTIKHSQALRRLRIKQGIIAVVSMVTALGAIALPSWILSRRTDRIAALDKELAALKPQFVEAQDLKDKIKTIEEYISTKNSCMEILREMSIIIPYDVTINRFAFEKNDSITMSGIAQSHASVVTLSLKLNESPLFESAKIIYTRKKDIPGEEIVDFEIFCGLNNTENTL